MSNHSIGNFYYTTHTCISDNLTFIRLNVRINSSRRPFWLLMLCFRFRNRFQTSILECDTASAIRLGICTLFCPYMVKWRHCRIIITDMQAFTTHIRITSSKQKFLSYFTGCWYKTWYWPWPWSSIEYNKLYWLCHIIGRIGFNPHYHFII